MSTERLNWKHPTSWVITLASLWFAFFMAAPVELVEEAGDEEVAEATSIEQADDSQPGSGGPSLAAVQTAAQYERLPAPRPHVTPISSDRPHAASIGVLSYAPKQSPPFSMSSVA